MCFILYPTGKVVIDAFRLINPNVVVLGHEPRQTTSNLGHLQKPSIQVCQPFRVFPKRGLNFFIVLGVDKRAEPQLLLHLHQLQEERTRAGHAFEREPENLGGQDDAGQLQRALPGQREDDESHG